MTKSHKSSSEHYDIIEDSIVFTYSGIRYYLPYFKKMGIKFETIDSVNKLHIANKLIRPLILEEMTLEMKNKSITLENRWLLSLLNGDMKEFSTLNRLIDKKNKTQLRLIVNNS